MMKCPFRYNWIPLLLLTGLPLLSACKPAAGDGAAADYSSRTVRIVTTTNIVADLVREVGGNRVDVTGLMAAGVDPHLYKASAGDVTRMTGADVIFYNGLHLEGKMTDLFERMDARGVRTVAVAEGMPEERLIQSTGFGGVHDPHVWFDVTLWMDAARHVQQVLAEMDPTHAATYEANARRYLAELERLDAYVKQRASEIPEPQRVIVTSHDAFGYYGRRYGFGVRGLQGISTAAEAGTADVQALAVFVAERRLPALFVETSVPPRGIEAVMAAVRSRGHEVRVGGHLYSDALGDPGTPEGSYVGMIRHNTDTLVRSLASAPPA